MRASPAVRQQRPVRIQRVARRLTAAKTIGQ